MTTETKRDNCKHNGGAVKDTATTHQMTQVRRGVLPPSRRSRKGCCQLRIFGWACYRIAWVIERCSRFMSPTVSEKLSAPVLLNTTQWPSRGRTLFKWTHFAPCQANPYSPAQCEVAWTSVLDNPWCQAYIWCFDFVFLPPKQRPHLLPGLSFVSLICFGLVCRYHWLPRPTKLSIHSRTGHFAGFESGNSAGVHENRFSGRIDVEMWFDSSQVTNK